MDGILIFVSHLLQQLSNSLLKSLSQAGLFSAIVTAMIVESYISLVPDPNDKTVALLLQISMQLGGNMSMSENPPVDSFNPTSSALRVNICWFLSLCLGLTCALAATLVQQWSATRISGLYPTRTNLAELNRARSYLQAIEKRPAPQVKARIRSYLYQGIDDFAMCTIVEGIPTLLHCSVFLFLFGLVDFLYSINTAVALVTMCAVATCFTLYAIITFLPIINHQCPYRTPFSEVFWRICQLLGILRFRERGVWKRVEGRIWKGQESLACADVSSRNRRDLQALSWTLESIMDDGKLATFAEGIPAFCSSEQGRDVMRTIAATDNLHLLARIISLLVREQEKGHDTLRSIICMEAISTICALYPDDPWTFLCRYEFDLHSSIMPATLSSNAQFAKTAIDVSLEVAKHITSCIMLHADRAQSHTTQAAHLRAIMVAQGIMDYDEPEFKWGMIMLKRWNSLTHILHILPDLARSGGTPVVITAAVGENMKSVFLCPEFVDTLLGYFRSSRLFRLLNDCIYDGVDLIHNGTHRERALACLKACVYMVEILEWTPYLRTYGIKVLDRLTSSTSDVIAKYAVCATARFAADLHQKIYLSREYSIMNNIVCFCAYTADYHFHPIATFDNQALPETMPHHFEITDRQMLKFYEQLPLADRLDLQLIHKEGGKALALCRGQVAIFVRLLERIGNSYSSTVDALKLAYDSTRSMERYLNARYSCCSDQARLVQLCVDYTHHQGMALDRLQPQRFCMDEILLQVISTVGDPDIIERAKDVVHTYSVAANGKYRTAAEVALNLVSLEASSFIL